jgi:hypothetical protein
MHTDKYEIERLNCVTINILSYFNAVEHTQYLTGEDNVCGSEKCAVKNIWNKSKRVINTNGTLRSKDCMLTPNGIRMVK